MLFHLYFFVSLGTLTASIFLILRGRSRLWAGIQLVLTALVFFLICAEVKLGVWLHSLDYDDPHRQFWQAIMNPYGDMAVLVVSIAWILFTAAHLALVIVRRSRF